ncbi:chromate transporter-domain-containing protein [Tribonema minus]|uniref:Chromate transporter-domain-containing protein n=1 Tax=Tribonema minus TaxID=303371 RepID=A0A836CG18_9STRA|nr:chromate transporter-domain-containing protein [Tribonema minus]
MRQKLWEVTVDYIPLAFTAFGGPPAHIALLYDRFVVQRGWLSEKMFAELFAISTALPGPASTQLAYTVALIRDGVLPALWAFLIWSLPGGIVMAVLGTVVGDTRGAALPRTVLFLENGLASVAVALVALAAYNLGHKLCGTPMTKCIAAAVFAHTICFQATPWMIPACMAFGGAVAYAGHGSSGGDVERQAPAAAAGSSGGSSSSSAAAAEAFADPAVHFTYTWQSGVVVLAAWLVLFCGALTLRACAASTALRVAATFFYVGSIVFGGGPVVVPLLYSYVVGAGWAESGAFLLGLAVINAMPGPNFNFAAYCGALAMRPYGVPAALCGAALAWVGMFAPGLMLKTGVLPLWRRYRGFPLMQTIFEGVNAGAVGLVFTATYELSQKALSIGADGRRAATAAAGAAAAAALPLGAEPLYVALAGVAFVAVGFLRVPAPLMIAVGGGVGALNALFA